MTNGRTQPKRDYVSGVPSLALPGFDPAKLADPGGDVMGALDMLQAAIAEETRDLERRAQFLKTVNDFLECWLKLMSREGEKK